ncbi:MAG TPA: TIGR02678 family protein [Actinomycetota bacterium]|nr:TIGR02678 family protein [Actinomycetota bacterium]
MSAPADVKIAIRALLASPLVGAEGPEALAAVRRHRGEAERFFADELGYRLDASRLGLARLAKTPGPGHEPRGLRTRGGRRFDARKYALACLVLATAEVEGDRTTARRLFQEVARRAGSLEGFPFALDVAADRRAFVQAVQAVQGLGVLELAEGEEERFARGDTDADALYRIDRERLALLPTTSAPPSLFAAPADLPGDVYPDTDEGRTRRRRHRVMRGLVEQPVLYAEDLSPEERDYFSSQRGRIERLLAERVGLTLEVRAEGWVAVDEEGELTDVTWPDYATPQVAALRICDKLGRRRREGDTPVWPLAGVQEFVRALAAEYAGYWRQGCETSEGAAGLTDEALAILGSLRLIRRDRAGIEARPAVGRFAAVAPAIPKPAQPLATQDTL